MVVRLFSAFIFLLTWPWHRCFVEPINEPIRSNPIHIFPWISFGQNYPKWSPFVMVKPGQTSNVDGAFTHGKQPRKLVYLMVKPWVLRMTSWFFQRVEWQAARLRILGLAPGWRKDTLQGSGISRCRGRGDPKKMGDFHGNLLGLHRNFTSGNWEDHHLVISMENHGNSWIEPSANMAISWEFMGLNLSEQWLLIFIGDDSTH